MTATTRTYLPTEPRFVEWVVDPSETDSEHDPFPQSGSSPNMPATANWLTGYHLVPRRAADELTAWLHSTPSKHSALVQRRVLTWQSSGTGVKSSVPHQALIKRAKGSVAANITSDYWRSLVAHSAARSDGTEGSKHIDLMKEALASARAVTSSSVSASAIEFLGRLGQLLTEIESAKLPSLHAVPLEDGSLLIEWIAAHWRMGFSIEPNPDDSSWSLVTDKTAGDVNAFGDLASVNLRWLVLFAMDSMR